jgi:N-acyl-D-aspartate/D-glutamate deacylase
VGPGHIDCHTHYDAQINWDPYCSNSGENGVTTVVAGNCGFAFAPCRPADRERSMLMMETTEQVPMLQMKKALSWEWETFPEWMAHLRSLPKGVNIMMYVPLNPLLVYVLGIDAAKSRRPSKEEMERMKNLLREGMQEGAAGMALSFLGDSNSHRDYDGTPMPADAMHPDDVVELSTVLREVDRGVVQLLALFGPTDNKDLAVRVERASGRPVLLNALFLSNVVEGVARPYLKWLSEQNQSGSRIYVQSLLQHQWQQFTLVGFDLNNQMPEWAELCQAGSEEKTLNKLKDPAFRKRMRDAYDPEKLRTGTGALEPIVLYSSGGAEALEPYVGKTLGEIAAKMGKHVLDTMLDLSLDSGTRADFLTPPVSAKDVAEVVELISHPHVLAGTSDGGAHTKFFQGGQWATEVVAWLGRDESLVDLEELHYRLAYQPARVMGIESRGAVLEGNHADLIVYDFEQIRINGFEYETRHDAAGGDWRRYVGCQGYRWIIVNGEVTFEDGANTGALPGQVLSPGSGALRESRDLKVAAS